MTDLESQRLLDVEHLRLLRLGYLISGWANAVWALFPFIHITLGVLLLSGVLPSSATGDPDARIIGLFFVIIGAWSRCCSERWRR